MSRVIIMGAAGRDFHNFNVCYRHRPEDEVVAFTAAQIPNIAGRRYPRELAGELYPHGIPIHDEAELPRLIRDLRVKEVVFAYSDIRHTDVMHKASIALAAGADFHFIGPRQSQLRSSKPVVAVCAVRTGAGKSPATRRIAALLAETGARVVVVRHPMPYGDLAAQAVQRFGSIDDLARHRCTIEEREEYEPHLARGIVVYAGVDYERILRQAESEADVILWDGGNNDWSFYVPDLLFVVADPHRAGHELEYHPGETNLRMADVVIISKVNTTDREAVQHVARHAREVNPEARIVEAACPIQVENPEAIRNARVLVVEDGPTLTHGEMAYGAGLVAATRYGARVVDPRPFAAGSIAETFARYPAAGPVLPAMGYSAAQVRDLEQTIAQTPCDLVLIATPIDLRRVVRIAQPTQRVLYELAETGSGVLPELLAGVLRHTEKSAGLPAMA